ncbi:hypothetical protein [Psychrobacter lutiphocae]|nr:hypothetical protein [Psychrobacter lutiphocae]
MSWSSQGIPVGTSPEGQGFVNVNTDIEPNLDNGKNYLLKNVA